MALANGVGETPFVLLYREVIRRRKKRTLECAGGMGRVWGEDKKWQREASRRVCIASGIRGTGVSDARAESPTGRNIVFSGAWWPDLEIDFLVSLEQRLTKLPLAGYPDVDKGH